MHTWDDVTQKYFFYPTQDRTRYILASVTMLLPTELRHLQINDLFKSPLSACDNFLFFDHFKMYYSIYNLRNAINYVFRKY